MSNQIEAPTPSPFVTKMKAYFATAVAWVSAHPKTVVAVAIVAVIVAVI